MGVGVLGWIAIGLAAGWLASMVTHRHHGLIVNLAIGLIGAVLGGWLCGLFGFYAFGFLGQLVVAFVGAALLLVVLAFVNRPRA